MTSAAGRTDRPSLTVAELLGRVTTAVTAALPGPVWVRGEISNLRRTSRGAGFFRLVDPSHDGQVVEVAARGRVMADIDRVLDGAGVGALRDGIEVAVRAVVGVDSARSLVRLSLLEVDSDFIAGRLAMDRQQVLQRLAADGSLSANGKVPRPLVPLRVGLITSRGSAAHADFIDHLRRSRFRFRVRTVHAAMQGESAVGSIVGAMQRLAGEDLDVVAVVRGGGSRLDLSAFDAEAVGRAVAAMPVPVLAGVGHEIDRSVVDEAASVSVKTPTAAAEWLVTAVADFADRIDTARRMIGDEARAVCGRAARDLDHSAAVLGGVRATIGRQRDRLADLEISISAEARRAVDRHRETLAGIGEMMSAMGIDPTLRRGFALVRRPGDQRVVRSAAEVRSGETLVVGFADGAIRVQVEDGDG